MIFKPNVNSHRRFSNRFVILLSFITLIMILAIYHTIESAKNPPIAKTNKTEYGISEKISLEIENKLPQSIAIMGCKAFIVQQKQNGTWVNSSNGLFCNRDEEFGIYTNRKSKIDFTLKYSGEYRIFIDYKMIASGRYNNSINKKPSYLPKLYSNEFSVK